MRTEEVIVAKLVEAALPMATMRPIESQSSGEWDYDLCMATGEFPFEVTRFTSQRRHQLYHALGGRLGERGIERRLCKNDWWVHPSDRANIRLIRRRVDQMLAEVEKLGLSEFGVNGVGADEAAVIDLWRELRIESGMHFQWDPPGFIFVALPDDHASLCAQQVYDAAVQEMLKPDNRRKLGASSAAERHLGVFIDEHAYPAQASMQSGYMPTEPLPLPTEITHVWLFTWVRYPAVYLVWQFSAASGWRSLGEYGASSPSGST